MRRTVENRIRLACIAIIMSVGPMIGLTDVQGDDPPELQPCSAIMPPCEFTGVSQCKPTSACVDGSGQVTIVYKW